MPIARPHVDGTAWGSTSGPMWRERGLLRSGVEEWRRSIMGSEQGGGWLWRLQGEDYLRFRMDLVATGSNFMKDGWSIRLEIKCKCIIECRMCVWQSCVYNDRLIGTVILMYATELRVSERLIISTKTWRLKIMQPSMALSQSSLSGPDTWTVLLHPRSDRW